MRTHSVEGANEWFGVKVKKIYLKASSVSEKR